MGSIYTSLRGSGGWDVMKVVVDGDDGSEEGFESVGTKEGGSVCEPGGDAEGAVMEEEGEGGEERSEKEVRGVGGWWWWWWACWKEGSCRIEPD